MLAALLRANVEFVLIGAHALAAHGIARATGDIDVFVRPSKENARRVFDALADFGAPIDAHGITPCDFEEPGNVYQIGLPPRRIDILTEISGVTFEEAWASKMVADISSMQIPVIGREALLKNKRASKRDKDLVDVRALEGKSTRR